LPSEIRRTFGHSVASLKPRRTVFDWRPGSVLMQWRYLYARHRPLCWI